MLRIVLASVVLVAVMVAVKDGRVLRRAGLVGGCSAVTAPAGDANTWQACRPGKLEGRPSLAQRSCTSAGVVRGVEYWRCPAAVQAAVSR
ncbi:MAG: hypothetical protein ACRDN6_09440 [Gaiellaceae bacterium]